MDPNAALAEIRDLIARHYSTGNLDSTVDAVDRTADLIEWLDKGGFLPTDWEPQAPRSWACGPACLSSQGSCNACGAYTTLRGDGRCGRCRDSGHPAHTWCAS